jgi:Mg/Co/Ni transporter MgtE
MNDIDADLLHAWIRTEPAACCLALAKLGAEERTDTLEHFDADDLALLLRHAPPWWLNVVQLELPQLPWNEAVAKAGIDINVIRMLRAARRDVRAQRLAALPERQRNRVARAMVMSRERVMSVLDDAPPIAHLSETVAMVVERIGRTVTGGGTAGSVGAWVYVVNDVEGYAGQIDLVDLTRGSTSRRIAELHLEQLPTLSSVLLLGDAVRLPDWQVHDTLPVLDEAGRFAGVVRLGDLVRAVHLTDAEDRQPRFNVAMLLVGSWTELLIALLGRRRST